MPYEKPPEKIKNLSEKKQRQWVAVFNSCWDEHSDDEKCHAMAWGAVKKSSDEWVAREMLKVAHDIEAADRIALTFVNEARAIKMKTYVDDFFGDVKKFKGQLNKFLKNLPGMVDNPRALAAFPELENIIDLSQFMSRNVMRNVMLSPGELKNRMIQVVTVDAR